MLGSFVSRYSRATNHYVGYMPDSTQEGGMVREPKAAQSIMQG
jgi:hypothetical protein